MDRRAFLRMGGLAVTSLTLARSSVMAGPFTAADFERLVPSDKRLQPEWVASLFARGTRTRYRWPESRRIGMPIGGICAGQLYLGGDGKLWHWDIFNRIVGTGAEHYAKPLEPASPLAQGFALKVRAADRVQVRALDHTGWRDIEFIGEYPIGYVSYRDVESPVSVALEAFSPFVPLDVEDSALPATILQFTVKNEQAVPVGVELAGWLENAVCLHSAPLLAGLRRNAVIERGPVPAEGGPPGRGFSFLACSAEPAPASRREVQRPDLPFDDFERDTHTGWTVEGTAFGTGPVEQDQMPEYQGKVGARGRRLVNSHAAAPGRNVGEKDAAVGTLTSRPFVIERDYITLLIGGGGHAGKTCINVRVDDRVVLSATGRNDNRLQAHSLDVRRWAGQTARLEIVDQERGGWGNIGVDDIVFSDRPRGLSLVLSEQPDFGTMGLGLWQSAGDSPGGTLAATSVPVDELPDGVFARAAVPGEAVPAVRPFGEPLVGALGRRFELAAGQSATHTFVVTWHFPNVQLSGLRDYEGRRYGKRFGDALAVAGHVARHFDRLTTQTRLWHDTWYDATLPHWLLERTMAPTSHLATNTCYWLGNGRFYAWEGVGCCAGTCTHVWHYAQALARLFPPLERSLRELADYGAGFDAETGRIRFRAEHNNHWAVDGQAGSILRTYREHQMSADDAFLRRLWPRVKRSLEFLISKDAGADGIIDGPQHNTLDADWWGEVAWLSGLYLAALRAGEGMATELGETEFAGRCRAILEAGRRNLAARLFNGEYFINRVDPAHLDAINSGTGCHIDQVLGDHWAWQVNLGRLLERTQVTSALQSLWRYNFMPDVGPYRAAHPPGRWYAMPGEAGLLVCSFPRADWDYAKAAGKGPGWAAGYFNECMNGFEYQAAAHMVWEGLLLEGFAVTRAVHDRYHATRRNPWNEVECGDHYARSLASYGVFLAACGYEHHGPKGHLGFAPRLTPEDCRCAFTTAEGWGTYSQRMSIDSRESRTAQRELESGLTRSAIPNPPAVLPPPPTAARNLNAEIQVRWGKLRLRTFSLGLPAGFRPTTVTATMAGTGVPAALSVSEGRAELTMRDELVIGAGQSLRVELA